MTLELEPRVGERPTQCYEKALSVAKKLDISVKYKFNDYKVIVYPSGKYLVQTTKIEDKRYEIDFETNSFKEVALYY